MAQSSRRRRSHLLQAIAPFTPGGKMGDDKAAVSYAAMTTGLP